MNIKGLTNTEVEERKQKGLINYVDEPKTKTIKEIIKTNALTPEFCSYTVSKL